MEFAPRTGRDGCKYNCQSADSSAEHHQHKNQPRDRSELSCDAEAYADGSDGGSGFEQTGDQRKPLKSADDNAACHKNSQIQEENCNRIPDAVSPNAWISRDPEVVKAYDADALCTFPFTAATYREMLATLCHVSSRKWAQNIRKDLPVLLIAGTADPVGDYGAGVRKVWAMLGDAGVQDLSCEIWHDARHELHNETNREEVFDYVYGWLMDRLPEDESQ